ncbi:MAG: nitrate/nitrite transporter NrtS [Pseudomonadota bacterium]
MSENAHPEITALSALRAAVSGRYVRRSLKVGAIVGVLLNVINQGDALLAPLTLNYGQVALTFLVPFCVSTFASWSAIREHGG